MRSKVPRIGRLLDAVGAALFLIGAAVYAWAWAGLREIDSFERPADAPDFAAVEHADSLSRTSRLGVGLMLAGGVVAVIAAVAARRARSPES